MLVLVKLWTREYFDSTQTICNSLSLLWNTVRISVVHTVPLKTCIHWVSNDFHLVFCWHGCQTSVLSSSRNWLEEFSSVIFLCSSFKVRKSAECWCFRSRDFCGTAVCVPDVQSDPENKHCEALHCCWSTELFIYKYIYTPQLTSTAAAQNSG